MYLEASTIVTRKMFIDYNWFNFAKIRHFRIVIPLVLAIYLFLIPIVLIPSLHEADTFSIAMSAVMVFCLFFLALLLIIQPMIVYRAMQKHLAAPQKYVFGDDHFSVHADNPLSKGTVENRYELLIKAYETDEYFFLYISPNQAFIVGKQDFIEGSPDELRMKLREMLKAKYKERHR